MVGQQQQHGIPPEPPKHDRQICMQQQAAQHAANVPTVPAATPVPKLPPGAWAPIGAPVPIGGLKPWLYGCPPNMPIGMMSLP